ncbi:hypothetical protein H6G74_12610 [Nostoc spongiaeforme FACHB-130]|uniref:Peptidase C39-like domain-containing protein n=1 Tax=Nostoc spongiaeforme FACHB-130 TaxID=1357510 RepID=A0ABR8FY26_9NOSO|nr:papain-like cysteine protease family protein [Nostoc spongiaeforme]MBD2595167.1 hypothetical protein [Nostoc spongiaeforme FACHB-130]
MGTGVQAVVAQVAPLAIKLLAEAAMDLLNETSIFQRKPILKNYPEDYGQEIDTSTAKYVRNQFSDTYGYFYDGMVSQPDDGVKPKAASAEIIVWNPSKHEAGDIEGYLKKIFQFSIDEGDAIKIGNNLASLFQERFKQVDLTTWSPFNKRYNMSDNLTVDIFAVTAAGSDENNNPMGIVQYCFVAYKEKSSLRVKERYEIPTNLLTRHILDVQWSGQDQSQWCWAACIQMATAFYNTAALQQYEIVNYVLVRSDCGNNPTSGWCNTAIPLYQCVPAYQHYQLTCTQPLGQAANFYYLQNCLNQNHLVEIKLNWTAGGGHVALVIGFDTNIDPNPVLYVNDPWYGRVSGHYDWILNGYGLGHWVDCMTIYD